MDAQNRSLEFAMLLTVPAAVALAVVPAEIVSVLFERGAFKASDTQAVAVALAVFAAGLPAFVMIKVFSPAFFAREDTKTPMRYAGWSLVINTLGSIGLFFLFREIGWPPHVGIAIATSIGGWINAGLLYGALVRRGHYVADRRLKLALPMIVLASAVLGVALWFGRDGLAPWLAAGQTLAVRAAALGVLLSGAAALYFAVAMATGALRISALKRALRRGR
jgi:putative peptidoglycan lipid II flippase